MTIMAPRGLSGLRQVEDIGKTRQHAVFCRVEFRLVELAAVDDIERGVSGFKEYVGVAFDVGDF